MSQLSQSFDLINASSFGTAYKTLQTHHSVQKHQELFTQTKFTVPSYHLHEVAEIVSVLLHTIYYQTENNFMYLYASTNDSFCCFCKLLRPGTTVTQTFPHDFINHNKDPTTLCWRFPQDLKTSRINPSVYEQNPTHTDKNVARVSWLEIPVVAKNI